MSAQPILSNINTVAGSKAAMAKEAAKADPAVKKKQMEMAKRIAREQFEAAFPHIIRMDDQRNINARPLSADQRIIAERARVAKIKSERRRHTLALLGNPANATLYSMHMERNMLTNAKLKNVIVAMKKMSDAPKGSVLKVVKSLRMNTKDSFFGCDVHVGVCTDANANSIEFIGEKDYWRREYRGKSTIFECLEQGDVVVQAKEVRQKKKSVFGKKDTEADAGLPAGETVVHIPLIGNRGGVGVIEIHGLYSEGISDPKRYERKVNVIQAMMNKKDFRFIHDVRLWRIPGDRIRDQVKASAASKFDRCDYYVVCGRIREVIFTRNGVPFAGGAHFIVVWEDGFIEEAVSQSELLKIYANTPQSLGASTELDVVLAEELLKVGKEAGVLVEDQRIKDALNELKRKLYFPDLGNTETFERTLDTALGVVRGIKEASIVVWDEQNLEAVPLCTRSVPSLVMAELQLSYTEVTAISADAAEPFQPNIIADPSNPVNQWVTMQLKVPSGYLYQKNPHRRRFFGNFCRSNVLSKKASAAEVEIFRTVLRTLSECMEVSWQRDLRNRHRKDLIKQIEGNIFTWRSLPIQDICHNTTQIAATVLPGADVYTGLLSKGAENLTFLAATDNSQMVDKSLKYGTGVSFDAIEKLETIIIKAEDTKKRDYVKEGALVSVYYGRKAFKGRIHRDRGHEKYDVEYLELDKKIEAGVDISRIVPMHTAFRMKQLGGKVQTPYVCIPLRHREKGMGVLAMDTLFQVPHAPYDPNPEYGLKIFLEQLGRILGTTVDLQRKKASLKALNLVAKNVNSQLLNVLEAAFDAIVTNMYYTDSIVCGRVVYEVKDVLMRGGAGVDVIKEWGKPGDEVVQRMETYHQKRSNQKPVQQHGRFTVWILLKLRGVGKMMSSSTGKIYIIAITQKVMPIAEPDLEFLAVLQKVLKVTVQSLDMKDEGGNTKDYALEEIRKICLEWKKYPREALFDAVVEKVNQVYLTANLYVGRLGAHAKELGFFLASGRSKMKGKRLRREVKQKRVSLDAIDKCERIVITPDMNRTADLVHFGAVEGFEYPFVAIPLLAHIDGPVGLLCGDACEDPSADAEDVGDVLSFFGTVGMYLSDPVAGYSAQDACNALKHVAYDYPTVRQGLREIKRIILSVVPYAKRIAEVCYEPMEVRSLSSSDVFGSDSPAVTTQDYMVLVRVCHAWNFSKNYSNPTIRMNWMGAEVYKNPIRSKGKIDEKPFILRVPQGVLKSKLQLQIVLQGQVSGATKDISKKSLGLQYLSNVPLYQIDHVLDSSTDPLVHVAEISLTSKMLLSSQVVIMNINSIALRGLSKADEDGLADPFVIIRWNDVEVTKTSVQKLNLDPVWNDLNINLNTGSKLPQECILTFDVWDQDLLGRGDFLGRMVLEGEDLVSLFSNPVGSGSAAAEGVITQDSWIDLVKNPKMAEESQTLVKGRCKITGSAVIASELNTEQIRTELDAVGKLQSDIDKEEDDDEVDMIYHECELRILCARSLKLPGTRNLPSTFAIVKFNGDELGRTAVVENSKDPEWSEEKFYIRSPGGDRLEGCSLLVELHHLDENGKGEQLGKVELSGRALVGLLACSAGLKARWVDIAAPLQPQAKNSFMDTVESDRGYGDYGQLAIAGVPVEIDIPDGFDLRPPDFTWLEVGVLDVKGLIDKSRVPVGTAQKVAIDAGARYVTDVQYFTVTKFNGTTVNRSKLASAEEVQSKKSKKRKVHWSRSTHSSVTRFPPPLNKPLEECNLTIQVWCQITVTIRWKDHQLEERKKNKAEDVPQDPPVLMSSCSIEGEKLKNLLGMSGFKTYWFELEKETAGALSRSASPTVDSPGFPGESQLGTVPSLRNVPLIADSIKLRCGPEGGDDLWDDDGREIWLDILACTDLPRRSKETHIKFFGRAPHNYEPYRQARSSVFCKILWNGKVIGITSTALNDCNPMWSDMRFVIKPPLIDGEDESLFKCTLKIEVYDEGPPKSNTMITKSNRSKGASTKDELTLLLGFVKIQGEELVELMGQQHAQRKWYGLIKENQANDPHARDILYPYGQLKVRAGLKDALDDPDGYRKRVLSNPLQAEECIISLVGASGLEKTDAFNDTNAYAVVEYNQVEIFRTNEVLNTLDPIFPENENFIFKFPSRLFMMGEIDSIVENRNGFDEEKKEKALRDTVMQQFYKDITEAMSGNVDKVLELSINVWNHNVIAGQADEFLGCTFIRGEKLWSLLAAPADEFSPREDDLCQTLTVDLVQSDYLTPDENEFAKGKLTFAVERIKRVEPLRGVNIWQNAMLWIKSCSNLRNTKQFGSGSDVYIKVYQSIRNLGGAEDLVHATRVHSSSLAPEFCDELASIQIPLELDELVDLWKEKKSIEAEEARQRAEWEAVAAAKGVGKKDKNSRPPVGASYVRQSGRGDLTARSRRSSISSVASSGAVSNGAFDSYNPLHASEERWKGVSIRMEVWDKTSDDFLGCVELSGEQLRTFVFKEDESALVTRDFSLGSSPTSNVAVHSQNSMYADTLLGGTITVAAGLKKAFDSFYVSQRIHDSGRITGRSAEASEERKLQEENVDESGPEITIHVHKAADLPKADGFLGKSDPFCIVKWNTKEIGRTAVIPKTLNPEWEDEKFSMKLPGSLKDPEEEKKEVNSVSYDAYLDIEVWDMDTVGAGDFLGTTRITGEKLKDLLGYNKGAPQHERQIEFELGPSSLLTPRGNALAVKGSIFLSAVFTKEAREAARKEKLEKENRASQIESNPGLQASKLELHVLSASGLPKMNMRGTCDSYIKVFWIEDNVASNAEPAVKTQVVSNSLNPVMDNEIVLLDKPAGHRIGECNIRLAFYNKGVTRDDFMGEVVLNGEDITKALPSRPSTDLATGLLGAVADPLPIEYSLQLSRTIDEKSQKYANIAVKQKAKVRFTLRQRGVDMSSIEDGPCPAGMKEMELTVIACSNLPRANLFGLSDPFCELRFGTRLFGKTDVISDNCDPVYEEQTFIVRVPEELGQPKHVKEAAEKAEFLKKYRKVQRKLTMEGLPAKDSDVLQAITEQEQAENPAPAPEVSLLVDCYDWNAVAQGVFLGSLELKGEELNSFAAGGRHHAQWFELNTTNRLRMSDQDCVVKFREKLDAELAAAEASDASLTGIQIISGMSKEEEAAARAESKRQKIESVKRKYPRVLLMFGPRKVPAGGKSSSQMSRASENSDEERILLDLEICAARGLASADTFGSSDPYVKVFWNNQRIGSTSVINNSLTPIWDDEKFHMYFTTPFTIRDCVLHLEVWDKDSSGPGNFLGALTLKGETLKELISDARFHPKWFDLTTSEMLPAAVQSLVRGEIEIRIGDAKTLAQAIEHARKYEIEVFGAEGLPRADGMFGLSDPYAIVKWNYSEIGRTPYVAKTLDPVWDTENCFHFFTDASNNSDIGSNHLQVDVWDYDVIGNGKFLGCCVIQGEDLAQMFKQSTLNDEDKIFTFELVADQRVAERSHDIIPKGTVEIRIRIPDDTSGNLASSMNLKWESERDLMAGQPTLELNIMSLNNLPITKVSTGKCSPMCVVTWSDDEIGSTSPGDSTNYEWSPPVHFALKLPQHAEAANTTLRIDVWDTDQGLTLSKGDHLGAIFVPFRGIMRMQHGKFTLPLNQVDKIQYVRGSITFRLSFSYPFWDSIRPHAPKKLLRMITIISAKNLPGINDETPSTKGVILVDGVVKAKTLVSSKTSNPAWAAVDCSLVIDMLKPIDIVVIVYHVDLKAKKEIPIGQYVIPFELLVRPPLGAFDSSLVPPDKMPPKKYKFNVGGTVKVQILQDDSVSQVMRPWSAKIPVAEAALQVHDITPSYMGKSKQDILYDGEMLTAEQKLWLGTAYDLSSCNVLQSRPEWLIMPLHDIGMRVGFNAVDLLGTRPGQRMALAIERDKARLNTSDAHLISQVWESVDHCIGQLRRKEIYRVMREVSLQRFSNFLQKAAHDDLSYNDEEVNRWIYEAIQTCCPGVLIYLASVASDRKSLKYTMFEANGSTRQFSIYEGQGNEWEFTGRHPPKSLLTKSVKDLKIRPLATYRPVPNTNFPRFVIPLSSGDVSLGFFGVENFDIHRGRMGEAITDEQEICKWFEKIGTLCGDAIYTGREKRSLRNIESFILGWGSSSDGVVLEILSTCMGVIQGCMLMEIWEIDKDNKIQSLAAQTPVSQPIPGRRVVISQLQLKVLGGKGLRGILKSLDSTSSGHEDSINEAIMQASMDSVNGDDDSTVSKVELDESQMTVAQLEDQRKADKEAIDALENRSITFLLGLRYDGVEQTKVFKMKEKDTRFTLALDIPFVITYDRNIHVSLYEITPNLEILADWSGKISFTSFDEPKLSTTLYAHKNTTKMFDLDFSTVWPAEEKSDIRADIDISSIKLFNIHIKSARDLKACDSDTSDPFCEIFWGEKLQGKTRHIEKTLNPLFDESFIIPWTGNKQPLIIDMYDMSFIGKGSFMGRVEIPFDLMCTPPPGDFEYPLKMKPKLNAKKQEKVGGMLKIEYNIELKKADAVIDSKAAAAVDTSILEIPRNVWSMKTPTLNLTINASTDLGQANLFGGGSDPFVVVYLDGKKVSDEPICKTKHIENNLNPVWNETFQINLGVSMVQGQTTAKDFPTVRLEVYDYNRVIKGEFLGCCHIGPAVYFTRKAGEFHLEPSSRLTKRQNRLVQGDLSATFYIAEDAGGLANDIFHYSEWNTLFAQPCCEVNIVRAKGLMVAKRMTGKSDPYVVVRWNGEEYGETAVKKGTLDPTWSNETFVIPLAKAGYQVPDLHIEVWDRDFFTGGIFLGEVVIPGDQVLHPSSTEPIDSPLTSKIDEPNKKIRGTLTYRMIAKTIPQRLKFLPQDFVEVKTQKSTTFQPQAVRIVRDPDSEEMRQKFEKINLPKIIQKARQDTDQYISNPFSRTGLISELHFGQVVSSCTRATQSILKTPLADILILPIKKADKDKETKPLRKLKIGEEPPKKNQDPVMCMVARYPSGKLPRRDIQFLQRFQDVLLRGLKISTHRKERIKLRAELEKNINFIHANAQVSVANDVIISAIVEIEQGLGCEMSFYALMPDSQTFCEAKRTRGDPDMNSPKANEFISLASRLCRHGVVIQYFRGVIKLFDYEWVTTSQMGLISIDSVEEQIDTFEGDGFVQTLKEQARYYAREGCMIFPFVSTGDPMLGVGVIHDLNQLPYASYRVKPLETRRKKRADTTEDSSKSRRSKKDYVEITGPEDGVLSVLRDSGKMLGHCLVYGRLNDCVKRMKDFEITKRTTFEDILMYSFRLIVSAVPAIRCISIWGVDFAQEVSMNKGKAVEKRLTFLEKLKAMLGLRPSEVAAIEDDKQENTKEESLNGFPQVLCGYFMDEVVDAFMEPYLEVMRGNKVISERQEYTQEKGKVVTNKSIVPKAKARRVSGIAASASAIRDIKSGSDSFVKQDDAVVGDSDRDVGSSDDVSGVEEVTSENTKKSKKSKKSKKDTKTKKSNKSSRKKNSASEKEIDSSSGSGSEDSDAASDQETRKDRPRKETSSWIISVPTSFHTEIDASADTRSKDSTPRQEVDEVGQGQDDKDPNGLAQGNADPSRENTGILDCSLYTSRPVQRVFGPLNRDALGLIHGECVRCVDGLKQKSFQVSTGHTLCRVGIDSESRSELNNMFGITDVLKLQQEEHAKRMEEEALRVKTKKSTIEEHERIMKDLAKAEEDLIAEEEAAAEAAIEKFRLQQMTGLDAFVEDEEEDEEEGEEIEKTGTPLVSPRGQGVLGVAGTSAVIQNTPMGQTRDFDGNLVMDPNRPKAPLPAGVAPSQRAPRSPRGDGQAPIGPPAAQEAVRQLKEKEAALMAKLKELEERESKSGSGSEDEDVPAKPENGVIPPNMNFFISVTTNGIGGIDGWGNLGPVTLEVLQNVARSVDDTVARMMKFRRYCEEERKARLARAEERAKAKAAEEAALREKEKAEKEEKRRLKALQQNRRKSGDLVSDGNSSDSSMGSKDVKKKARRGSVVGKSRRASISRKASKDHSKKG